ncbi:retrovirus-related pol polyprotein from transposon TNT 1-94 [Tanacetum coccineum]
MELFISKDLVHTAVNSLVAINDYQSMEKSFMDEYEENLKLQTKIYKKNDMIENVVIMNFQNGVPDLKICAFLLKLNCNETKKLKANNVSIAKLKEHIANLKGKNVAESVQNADSSNVGVSCSTEASGSKPKSNTKKDRITQTSSSNKKKNKVEDQPRIAKSSLNNVNRISKIVCTKNGTVRFGNDQIAKIMGYGDYQLGNVTISRVYYVEGLGYNLFSMDGVDLLSGSRDINFYTISLDDMLKSSAICLLSKASKTKSWLWHRWLSYLNFDTLNQLAKQGLVQGLPKLKFEKDHLCSACSLGKSKKSSHKLKANDINQERLYLLHMDLCGPMRVESINVKKYIFIIVDDYSRFMWVKFLRLKDEAHEVIIKCLKQIQVCMNATVHNIRTDNGTEFVNQTLKDYYENVRILHQTSIARTPQQNGVVKRWNRTLVEAARTMLIFSKALLYLWAEAVSTTCYT